MLTTKMIQGAPTVRAASVDFSGRWENQLGSIMTLAVSGQNIIGSYESPVSDGGSPVTGDLVGFVDGDLLSFVVNWSTPASLTAWTGQLIREGRQDVIKTLWLLVKNVQDADEPTGLWQSTLAGADEFTRV